MFQSVGKGAERNCIGLYSALGFFTTLFITRHGRRGLRQFINSSMANIHDPEMLARYVLAPVNHILIPQRQFLQTRKSISVDAAPWQKLNWVTKHILFKRMLGILSTHGLQPECNYQTDHQKEFIEWIVKDSQWGHTQKDGFRGVTQMVFLQYARDMAPKSLYESLTVTSKSRLTGEAVFRETVHRDNFIEDDYGLKTSNNITDHFKSIIEGTKAFEHEYLMEAFQKAKSGTTPRKKKSPKKADSTEATTPTQQTHTDNDTSVASGELRKSERQLEQGKKRDYTEEEPEDEGSVTDNRTAKRSKKCQRCAGLVAKMRELERLAGDLTKDKIVETLQNALAGNLPDDLMEDNATE
jgi:hypothetical protein